MARTGTMTKPKLANNKYMPCHWCGEYKPPNDFYEATNKGKLQYPKVSICKQCMEDYCIDVLGNYIEDKFRHMLRMCDVPFSKEIAEKVNNLKDKKFLSEYFSRVHKKFKHKGYADGDSEKVVSFVTGFELNNEIIKFWGAGLKQESYETLNDLFIDMTEDFEVNDIVAERIIKAICIAELKSEEAIKIGDIKAFNDLRKTISNLMDDGNLKPKQNKGGANEDAIVLGKFTQKYEYTKPIPAPKKEWRENDWIGKNIKNWFFGHLANMMGYENYDKEGYFDELDMYTVKRGDE